MYEQVGQKRPCFSDKVPDLRVLYPVHCTYDWSRKEDGHALLVEAGAVCSAYQDRVLRNLSCSRLQVDEMWAFIAAK